MKNWRNWLTRALAAATIGTVSSASCEVRATAGCGCGEAFVAIATSAPAVGGAVAGAAVGGEHHRGLGALIGGAVGAGGGYIIGANTDRTQHKDHSAAEEAGRAAQTNPATAEQARAPQTADLNGDGFVTMDEVVAMRQAGLPDQVMIDRLRATGQVFELTPEQQDYLRRNGVSSFVISQMSGLNRNVRGNPPGGSGVISRPEAP